MLPSKELLTAVLGCDAEAYYYNASVIKYKIDGVVEKEINIYELMHIMKEWALKQGFYTKSQLGIEKSVANIFNIRFQDCDENFFADTELEAVTKACEWILEQQNEQ